MWSKVGDYFLKLHASGLGHDAVIEILIALLGVMIAVLTLIAGLFSVAVAIVGVFGYQNIREMAKERAEATASETAQRVAEQFGMTIEKEIRERAQAAGMPESQADEVAKPTAPRKSPSGRVKKLSDKGLSGIKR